MRTYASGKLNKLYKSWRSSPHCGMPSRLKTRLGQPCQTEYLPSAGRHYIRPRPSSPAPRVRFKGGVLWSKDKLKATKGCCQSR